MFSTVIAGALRGIDSYLVHVEVDASKGLPCFELVGYLSSEAKEARERVRVALKNSEIIVPPIHITVNLSPADIRKDGTAFDLPIAIGILSSLGYIPTEYLKDYLVVGELGLSGEIKPIKGILPIVMEAKAKGIKHCIVPKANEREGAVIQDISIIGVSNLLETLQYLSSSEESKEQLISPVKQSLKNIFPNNNQIEHLDFLDIAGQETLKRAVEIAAAGFHHLMMVGPPGSGKTMAAKRIPSILPPISLEESLEVSKVYSVAGMLSDTESLILKRPFLSPHHTISEQALAGGGHVPRPGIISMAHRGVLFLDEMPEFKRGVLEVLRQPLEDKKICIARIYGNFTYPADFMLVAAMNPCACGYYPDRNRCNCSEAQVRNYVSKISGPLLDRIDICAEASKVNIEQLSGTNREMGESSERIRERVLAARRIQEQRFLGTSLCFNAQLSGKAITKYCFLGESEQRMMEQIFKRMNLSARAYHKILKVARTIADLDDSEVILERHLGEASGYRMSNLTGG